MNGAADGPKRAATTVAAALGKILAGVKALSAERIAVETALGRTLAAPLVALRTQPPFTTTAMDGYATQSADVAHPPQTLAVIGEAAAGRGFDGVVQLGQAVRIFTGAPLPRGADTIIIQENTTRVGDRVTIVAGTPDPEHIRPEGGDFRTGAALLSAGHVLNPRTVALAASMGHGHVLVTRKPLVAILATGDELVLPGEALGPGQIVASNHLAITSVIELAGGSAKFLGIARDNRPDLERKLAEAACADVLVTIGGASVGDHDLVAPALQDHGVTLGFWKIAMRPGKPLMFGLKPREVAPQRVIGLPGNPVSAYVCTRLFVEPLVRAFLGQRDCVPPVALVPVATDLPANGVRAHYMRAVRSLMPDGQVMVRPLVNQDSSLLSVLAEANCLIVRPIGAAAVVAGMPVPVLPLDASPGGL